MERMRSDERSAMNDRPDWNRISLVLLVLLFFGLYVANKIWPGETDEQREQDRQAEFRALHKAEETCEQELPGQFYGDDDHYGTEDFQDCVGYRMRVYHRGKKLAEKAEKEIEQFTKEHPTE